MAKKPKRGRPTNKEIERRTRQQAAEELRGMPVIQLDYITGEYVGEYPSITQAADDLDVPISTILGNFSSKTGHCCIARVPRYELMLMKKSAFEALRGSYVE